MSKKNPLHPFSGVDMSDWLRLLLIHRGVSRHAMIPALQITACSGALILPKIWEKIRYDSAIASSEVTLPPLFILGHWRSGTTFLHNVLSQDPQFGYLSVIQSAFPNLFMTFESALSGLLPDRRRLMDNVRMGASVPSEEEIAMAVMAPGSFWHGYYFTDSMDDYFDRYVMFRGIDQRQLKQWKHAYMMLIKKLTLRYDGKRLVLKNPSNTARIEMLLELFPDARFVHIYRDPYDVYLSRMSQFDSAVKWKALHNIDRSQWEQRAFRYYRDLMGRLIEQVPAIPPHHYTELSFESLRSNPLQNLERIYSKLSLPGWSEAQPHFERHVNKLRDYRQNHYDIDTALVRRIDAQWGEYIDRWNYQRRAAQAA